LSTYRVSEVAPGVMCCSGFCRRAYSLGKAAVAIATDPIKMAAAKTKEAEDP
jgi:hypothetical protein